ncbi:MAG TPA: LLM class flavin-dependent oxidoreductase [Rhodopila sp.]|uniref:LLM class flavin-dependent oxidoreductase n=1 Tax=Rhodopila sp. TaxID=2480087 RepID=UPI002B86007F|nr:LLM class flavin-dependent oxidoreductase [Rhodopila sp.]HVY17829.1 LLM class flavin-dependent oxidoreductase [Rhodopila sp.]
MRQMVLVGFLQAQNCTTLASAWRHPDAHSDFTTAAYYQRIGQVLEAGKFQLAFFDDRLAMPDIYGGNPAEVVANGVRVVKIDPVAAMMAMGFGTRYLGLGSTASTTYYEPFDVARRFQTVDHMLGGRAAWNVVTSVNDAEAQNMGRIEHMEHDARYDRADEFMEIVHSCWDGWEDGALVVDKKSGLFADPGKVHRLEYQGKYLKSSGTFTVPRSPQGHPVVIQAGSSNRGKTFSARWAETVFVAYEDLEAGKRQYTDLKAEVARLGRDPDRLSVNTIAYPVVAETKAEAEDKMALIDSLYKEVDGLSLLSEALNYDFKKKSLDEAFSAEELEGMSGMQAMRDRVMRIAGRNPTVRDFLEVTRRGRPREAGVGSGKEVADRLEQWFTDGACDGFVVAGTHMPGTFEDFVRFVTPELQRRGLFRSDYTGATLRENLGLPVPKRGSWRLA